MQSVGETLRSARESKGVLLAEIASQTRISRRYLEAIEADQPEGLPGGFFYRSFVRQYAGFLHLNVEEIDAQLDRIMPGPAQLPAEDAVTPETRPDVAPITGGHSAPWRRRTPLGLQAGILLTVVLACAGLYAWWDRVQRTAAGNAARASVAESHAQPQLTQPAAQPEAQPPATPQPAQEPAATTLPAAQDANPPPAQQPAQQLQQPQQQQQQQQQQAPEPVTPAPPQPAPAGEGRPLVMTASSRVWVSVLAEGKNVFIGTLDAGETRTIAVKDSARLLTGNAGALELTWNGKPVGPLGPRGQVRRVLLTPGGAEVVAPQNPPEEQQ